MKSKIPKEIMEKVKASIPVIKDVVAILAAIKALLK